ncbi:hypothetical protein CONPUDRAFT_87150 [Coniophora puteana RWD-64-598 SS2]|uniref:Uncharacterized protein n=1 Tax=Coniophora puteana (strain RWD-64-598) TaxID=741705 RepID=A0A5M3N7P1_CONPW|nr:uncharacterized protein CONPUDRAFT_87150 [Coniophora puteana RWD-64-598 SS2]EIW87308.1 hypothetical protein CONPUDRAFT_87150 [Coniophora puteana RWD-64-598 SS2]
MIPDSERTSYLAAGWEQDYEPTPLRHFSSALQWYESNYDKNIYSGRMIAILQSSGAGKSRLVDALATEYPVFSIVCCSHDRIIGWPPSDQWAMKFFEEHSEMATDIRGEEMAAAFLGALIGALADQYELSLFKGKDRGFGYSSTERASLFEAVYTKANTMLRENEEFLIEERKWIDMVYGKAKWPTHKFPGGSKEWHQRLFARFCGEPFEEMSRKLEADHETRFLLAFDNCADLGRNLPEIDGPSRQMSSYALLRVLKAAEYFTKPVCFWFLPVDTNPSEILPHPSDVLRPLPPFVYLGFDQFIDRVQKDRASDSLCLRNLRNYGRPLWSTVKPSDLLKLARQKLFSGHLFFPDNSSHVFAAFAFRACIELNGSEGSSRLAASAVAYHMNIFRSFSRDSLNTISPSEPMLAIASASALTSTAGKYLRACNTLLEKLVSGNLLSDVGDQGELCSRLLLLLARDVTTFRFHDRFVRPYGSDEGDGGDQIYAISLTDFLDALLGPSSPLPRTEIDRAMSFGFKEMELARELRAFCDDKWVNFTHFVRIHKTIDHLTLSDLETAWFRGAAIQCDRNQPVIDGGIVYYDGLLDAPYDPSRLGFLAYQTTGKRRSGGGEIGAGLTAPPILRPQPDHGGFHRYKPKTIVMLMDLAAASHFEYSGGQNSWLRLRAAQKPARSSWAGYADPQRGEEEPESFFINVRGCSSTEYPLMRRSPFGYFADFFRCLMEHDNPAELKDMEGGMLEAMDPFGGPAVDRATTKRKREEREESEEHRVNDSEARSESESMPVAV